MKIRDILMRKEHDLTEGSEGLIGADLIQPILDQIRRSNRIVDRREQLVQDTSAAADPVDVPEIEPPAQVGAPPRSPLSVT